MYLSYKSSYMNGLFDMASGISKNMGPSSISVYCFKKKNFIKEFKRFFRIKSRVELIDNEETFDSVLFNWFNNKDIVSVLLDIIFYKVGKLEKFLTFKEDNHLRDVLSGSEGGYGGYYFVEEVYFVEFSDCVVCFIVGNNE